MWSRRNGLPRSEFGQSLSLVVSPKPGLSCAKFLDYIFMNLKNVLYVAGTNISHVQPIIFIPSECPFHTLGAPRAKFQIALQRSIRSTKRCAYTNF